MEGDRDVRPKAAPRTALAEGEGVAMVCVRLLFGADENEVFALTGVVFSLKQVWMDVNLRFGLVRLICLG